MKLTYKKATEKDWKTVSSLEKSVANKFYFPITKEKEVKDYLKRSYVFLILKDRKAIGTVSYELKNNNHVHFDGLTVLPMYQRRGVATKAMIWALKKVKDLKRIDLVTHPLNTPALRLYLELGFHVKGWKNNYFGDGEPRLLLSL